MSDKPEWGTQEWHCLHPIYGTDMTKPLVTLVEEVRSELAKVRGKLGDIKRGFGWSDRFDTAEHGLTLVISYLYGVNEEIKKVKKDEPR